MNITALHNGTLVALFRSRWADNIYYSQSTDDGESWSVPEPTTCLTTIRPFRSRPWRTAIWRWCLTT
jgi:predicted neuraminidase